jgi:hypothetical protein
LNRDPLEERRIMLLGIERKKGSKDRLDGRLTVYAVLDIDPSELLSMKSGIASMIYDKFLVAQGNYKDQNNLRDFLKSEMGISLEEGLEEFLEKLGGLESALDPQKLRDKIENFDEMEEFIPTPAKIVPFHSESEILGQDGDVFFAGTFKNVGNAILSVNSFPILYQARFREQEIEKVRNEIELLISQIEKNELPEATFSTRGVNLEEKIIKEFIPNMLYCRKDKKVFSAAEKQFRAFMRGYSFKNDVDRIVSIIADQEELTAKYFKLLELYAKKISEVRKENFEEVEKLRLEIERISLSP